MKHIRTILFLSLSLLAPLFAVDPEVRKAKPDQLKKMLADNPGNTDLAIDILRQLLIRSRKDRNYAVERLHALVKIGALSTTDQDLLKAQTVMFSDALKRKDTFAASHVIRNLEHLEGKGPYWQLLNIQLLAAVHRLDLAWNAYDFLSRQISTSHSDTRVRRVLPYIQRLFYKYKAERFNVDLNQGQNIQWIESISKGIDQKDALAIQTVMEDALKRQKLFIDNEKSPLQKNLWRELITKLSMDPKSVTNFRALQETGAKKMTRRWRQKIIDRPDDDLLKVWRNFPWSNHGYIALFEYANRELSRGNPELAARCFKDLQKFSHDDRQRRKAETAYFLCLAETPSRHDELRALLAKADSKSERSWFGKPVKLDAIIKSLKIESAVVTDYKMDHKRIQLPRISSHHPGILYSQKLMPNWSQLPWPLVTLQSDSKTLFVSAPTFIAGYAPDNLETPIWIQQNASLWRMGSRYEKPFIPDLAFPAIGKNRIYSRWAYPDVVGDRKEDLIFVDGKPRKDMPALQHRRLQKHITCFDSSNGKMIWTTVDKTYWQKCIPAGDPILNGERLYVSAIIQDLDAFNLEESDFYVFCLDPKNGNLIWSRLVGRTRFSVSPKRREWVTGVHAKLTFHQGSLYAVSNGGLMARLDARDGLVEWSRSYKGYNPLPANFSHYIAKLASPPIILDDLVIMPAKDQPGLMALDRARGNIVWESPYIPRSRIIGHLNGRLFVEGRKTLVSVDVKTGEAMWIRNYRAIPVHAVLNKDKLSLIHGSFYQAIDIDTGKNLNQQAQKTAFPHNVTQISSTWYELNSDRKGGGHLSARKGQRSSTTKLYVPSTDNPAMIYLYADGFLEAVKTKEQVTAWQKLMPSDLRQMYFDQQQILIIGNQSVKSMHAISGDHRWVYRLPSILEWSRLDRQLLLRTEKTVTLLDLTTGKQIWQKPVPYFYTYHSMHLTKTAAHLFGRRRHKKEKKNTWTGYIGTVDSLALATGAVIKMTTFPEAIKAHRTSKSMARFNESNLWMFGAKGHLFHMDLNSYKVRQFGGNFIPNPKSRWEVYIHDAKGGTIFVETDVWRGKRKRYLFKASSTKGINIGPGINYLLNENLICEIRGRRLRIHNPATKKDQVIAIVPPSCEIKAHHLSDNLLYVASVQSPAKQEISPVMKSQFRIDVFDINKGHFVYGKRLPVNPAYWSSSRGSWGNQFVWTKSHLFITDNLGLHSLALGSEQDLYERKIIYRASQKIVVDGHDNDFVAINAGLMPDKYKDVKIYATHDDRFLYLSVSYKNLRLSPLLGSGRFGGDGDWVEFSLACNKAPRQKSSRNVYQWDLGLDIHGRVVHRRTAPGGIYSTIHHDTKTMRLVYESAIPLSQLCDTGFSANRSLNLSVSVYDTDMLPGWPISQWVNMPLYLHAYTKAEEQAALLLARSLPHERESYWLLRKMLRIHVKDWPVGRSFITEQLTRSSPIISSDQVAHQVRVLKLLHKHQKLLTHRKPGPMITDFANSKGIGKDTMAWYSTFAANPKKVRLPQGNTKEPLAGIELLKKTIPLLGGTDIADPFFSTLMGLAKPTLDDELKQYHWFLKKLPNHPRAIDYLNGAWEIEMTKSKKTAAANMDKMMLDCKIPPRTIYAFRRSRTYLGHRYIKQWHALGPFPTNFEKDDLVIPLPHMKAKIDLRDKYVFPKQTLVWTALTSKKNQVRPYPKHRAGDIHSNSVYAVSWIKMEKAGVYVLEFAQRGAARVWVNRRLVHNDPGEDIRVWRPRNYIDYSPMDVKPYAVSLPKGWSRILVESSPGLGGWRFTAEIIRRDGKGPVTTTKVMVPRKGPVPTTASTTRTPSFSRGHGLKAAYYDEGNFTNLKHVKIEKNTNVVWSIESPAPGVHRDYFSTRMIAKIKPRFTETYTFTVQVNDGVRLWVDGKLLIHNWRHHSSRKDRAKIKLEKDKLYDIKIEAHEITDWAGLHIWWGSASQRKEIIPNSRLFANWHDTDTFIADERATKPGGPPRFAGYKIRPDSVWMPAGWSFTDKAVPLDQYGAVLNVNKAFDESGKPVDTSPKWTAEPGGYVNLFRQYGGGRYLPNRKKKASGTINANGTFKSDGSKGVVTIIATSKKYPEISARVPLAVDDMPSIMPMPSDLTIGQFAGDIDRIRISSSELTPQEIANRAKGKFAPDKNLIADWTFDKLVGNGFENMVEKNKQLKAVIVGNVRHITEGKITYARFDGGNCVVKRNHLLNFSQSATIELWVRPLVKRPAGIMLDQCRWGTVQGYRIFFSGLSTHGLYSHGGMYAGHTYQTDKFTYLAVVYGKNGKRQLFINGKLKTERKTGPQVVGN